jgi:hypothetical protein
LVLISTVITEQELVRMSVLWKDFLVQVVVTDTGAAQVAVVHHLQVLPQKQVERGEAGFFEWPRDSTSEDIAAALGISQPAFAQRLRAAESKLFDAYCRGVRRQSAGRLRS